MDAVLLSRLQMAFTLSYHILFPTLTIGLAWFLVILEFRWLRQRPDRPRPELLTLYRFWSKLFALNFGMGVVSGIVLSYEFGTNFAPFSAATGNVIGPLMSYEVLSAFFLEAGFLGVMLFGHNRVPPWLHFFATLMVGIGTLMSAFWILAANSWMQTPAGTELIDGRFVVVDWWAVVFNPSFPYRLSHMLAASFLTTAFVVLGVSAFQWRRKQSGADSALKMALAMAMVVAPLQIFLGDLHGLQVRRDQPLKLAAMEGVWETERGAPLLLFAIPDQQAEKNHYEIAIPKLASLIVTHDADGEIRGLKEVPASERPKVLPVFWSFRVMVALGMLMLLFALWGSWRALRGHLLRDSWWLRLAPWLIPCGFVATLAGWWVAEIGRQPWLVYGLLRTVDGASVLPAERILESLMLFVLVYVALFGLFLFYVARVVRAGLPALANQDLTPVLPRSTAIVIDPPLTEQEH